MNINDNVCIYFSGRGLVEITIIGTNGNYHTCEEDNKMQHIVHKDDIYTPAQGRELKTLQDFYDFYFAIPDELWCTENFTTEDGRCCAAGHLGRRPMVACPALDWLCNLLGVSISAIYCINDIPYEGDEGVFLQPTPKQRILALIKSKL